MSVDSLFTRETFGDILVNLVPLGVLGGFVAMFLLASPYAKDPVYTTVQLSLVGIPAAILPVLTYYALKAVNAAERDAGADLCPGYSECDAEAVRAADDD